MMPSAASSGPSRSSLRRWGPLVGIAAVVALVAVLVVSSGGDDEGGSASATTSGATTTAPAAPEGAISFSQAQEQGLDVTFPATCDTETGRVMLPAYFAPECYADVADNGGATADGVTADSITIVVYLTPDQDDILDFITAAIANDDTQADVEATFEGYRELFQAVYQTYGREVRFEYLRGSGGSLDEVAARADAVRAVEDLGAFAVLGTPVLTPAWSEELTARDVICIGCFGLPEPDPDIFQVVASTDQTQVHLAEYIVKKLAGQPAEFAGDPALQASERVFGHLFLETTENSLRNAEELAALLGEDGVSFTEQIPYALEPTRLQEQATSVIARFKAAGITTVVVQGDPVAMGTFTREATAQNWFPEWVIGGSALMDTAAFGRTYDPQQWSHAFGISSLGARIDPGAEETLYEWYFGEEAPADDTEGVIWPGPAILFAAIQAAGPNLTQETLRQGLYSLAPTRGSISAPSFSYGDHGAYPDPPDQAGIDDFTEIWWDAEAVGPDELGREAPGLYRYVDGGVRYFPGEWPSELRVFDPEGSVTIYDEIPPAEAGLVRDYDPPR